MEKDLFGQPISSKEISCSVYHDEREIPKKWLYHGFLFVPTDKTQQIFDELDLRRKVSKWNKEIHFAELVKTRTENMLAKLWAEYFCFEGIDSAFFYLFGVDLSMITKELWQDTHGKKAKDYAIYNRFFQIGLYSSIKWLFLNKTAGYKKVTIDNIYSDSKSRNKDDKFHTQPIKETDFKALMRDESITFGCDKIIEVDSNHEKEEKNILQSHIVQFIDLVIGATSQVLDNTSKHEGKCMVAEVLISNKFPHDVMDYKTDNFKSKYYKKYAQSFFPKMKLEKDAIINKNIFAQINQFYVKRDLMFCSKNQGCLFG
jgi:hypothetical protein